MPGSPAASRRARPAGDAPYGRLATGYKTAHSARRRALIHRFHEAISERW